MRISDWSSDVCSSDLDGVFAAFHELLHQQFAGVARGEFDRRVQVGFAEHAADADAGAFQRLLDDHRQAQLARGRVHSRPRTRCGVITLGQPDPARRRQAFRGQHLLGPDLAERQRAAEHARTGVRHAQRLEQALQHAALAVAAVEDVEDAVEVPVLKLARQGGDAVDAVRVDRSEEHTSELQSLMRISYAAFCLKKKKTQNTTYTKKKFLNY